MLDTWEMENPRKKGVETPVKEGNKARRESIEVNEAVEEQFTKDMVGKEVVKEEPLEKAPSPQVDEVVEVAADPAKPITL